MRDSSKKMIRTKVICVILVCVLALSGCTWSGMPGTVGQEKEKETAEIFAMNTIMDITVYGENATEVLQKTREMIQHYEALFSVNIETSDVAKLNRAQGKPVKVEKETYDVLERSLELSQMTEGLFDVSIYPLVKAWGFTTESYQVPEKSEIQEILKNVDYRNIRLLEDGMVQMPKEMQIDLGAIAKGYLSQKLVELFEENQVTAAVISLGGNVQTYGTKPDKTEFQVGITDPTDGVQVYGAVRVTEKAIVTSGGYQRFFEKEGKTYHHIMDKRTGAPADSDLASVTVVTDRGDVADALATAFYIMGKEKTMEIVEKHREIQVILIDKDNQVWCSEGLLFERMEEE